MYQRILVATDGSPLSKKAVSSAIELALSLGAELVAEAVISAAKKYKCDLIVMASHGRRGIKRLLLGSETQHVLTHSHIPVLVLR